MKCLGRCWLGGKVGKLFIIQIKQECQKSLFLLKMNKSYDEGTGQRNGATTKKMENDQSFVEGDFSKSCSNKLKSGVEKTKKKTVKKKKKKKQEQKDEVTKISKSFSKLDINRRDVSKQRTPQRRSQLGKTPSSLSSIKDVAELISSGGVRNIIVMAGAGISTGSGIPDFRTPGTGLYDNLHKYKIPAPTAVFDRDYFNVNPKPFFELAKELYPSGKYRPNIVHYFVRCLHEKGLLLRMYTQNIDVAGIPPSKLVEAHGTFSTASCTKCGKKCKGEVIKDKILKGVIPRCQLTPLCYGTIKPDIVFFGEDLPKRFYYYLKDFPSCDLLLVFGTSLQVEPFASLVDSARFTTPRLLLNMVKVGPFVKRGRRHDLAVTGDIMDSIQTFVDELGWDEFIKEVVDSNEKVLHVNDPPHEDSGISSASSTSSERKVIPPVDKNVKRYFHSLRSTPLPNNNKETGSGEPPHSYYEFMKHSIQNPPPKSTSALSKQRPPNKQHPPVIQYTRTILSKSKSFPRMRSSISVPSLYRGNKVETTSESETSDASSSSGVDS
uniref:NAD-dependent protein deacetylase sirtuin-2 isoform X2 n=1 Tax=Ciona intestinalis TaxID=7719 RepID=UPI000EF54FDF|nr:NAD-dependent protein deacetylase sirtuin-2 isoform X2 [Ciona intestinalis]|eukprot:XP_026695711.1 NAD-dependent protein deacetylase sirtuin-2 isoform X2 [Ciona intestinalis]